MAPDLSRSLTGRTGRTGRRSTGSVCRRESIRRVQCTYGLEFQWLDFSQKNTRHKSSLDQAQVILALFEKAYKDRGENMGQTVASFGSRLSKRWWKKET